LFRCLWIGVKAIPPTGQSLVVISRERRINSSSAREQALLHGGVCFAAQSCTLLLLEDEAVATPERHLVPVMIQAARILPLRLHVTAWNSGGHSFPRFVAWPRRLVRMQVCLTLALVALARPLLAPIVIEKVAETSEAARIRGDEWRACPIVILIASPGEREEDMAGIEEVRTLHQRVITREAGLRATLEVITREAGPGN